MKFTSAFVLLTAIISFAASAENIDVGNTFTYGYVVTYANDQPHRDKLTLNELRSIESWLVSHKTGWYASITEAPDGPDIIDLDLTYPDGKVASLRIIERRNGSHYLQLVRPDKTTYSSPNGTITTKRSNRELADSELNTLMSYANAAR